MYYQAMSSQRLKPPQRLKPQRLNSRDRSSQDRSSEDRSSQGRRSPHNSSQDRRSQDRSSQKRNTEERDAQETNKFSLVVGIIAVIILVTYYRDHSLKESKMDIKTEEFLWKISKVYEKMKNKDPVRRDFSFASQSCSMILMWEKGYVAFFVQNEKCLPNHTDTFLGIGIEQCKEQMFSKWYEFKMEASSLKQNTDVHQKVLYIPIRTDMICYENVLTFFFRISNYPSPSYKIAENRQGYEAYYNEGKKNIYSEVLNNLSQNFKDLYLEDQDPDVRIFVRHVILRVHRAILKARSPVLAAALKQDKSKIVEDRYDSKDFEIFLLFLYSGTVYNLNTDNVMSVYDIAYKYEVPDLMEACAGYMVSKLTVHSVSNVINVALKHGDYKLKLHATRFFLNHAEKIFPTSEWQIFLKQNPTEANELMIKSYSYKRS